MYGKDIDSMENMNNLIDKLVRINFASTMNITELISNGVLFPEIPEYVLSNDFKLCKEYIPELAKEMLFAWSTELPQYTSDKVFSKNAWSCIKPELTSKQQKLSFPEDFQSILSKMKQIKEDYKEYRKTIKDKIKAENLKKKEKYGKVIIDGKEVETAYMIEPPGFLRGRGAGATRGLWTYRVEPEDVNLNASNNPPCTVKGHQWGSCELRQIMAVATYNKRLGPNGLTLHKSVNLSSKSQWKGEHDIHKFDKAALIDKNFKRIVNKMKKAAMSDDEVEKQVGCCAYLVAMFGIRAGNPSGARDNGVVGASTLLVKHIELLPGNKVGLHFIGKDSIPFDGEQKVDKEIYNALSELIEDKDDNDRIFSINSGKINVFLKNVFPKDIPDLTLKNFRTFYGTSLLAKEIQAREWSEEMTDKEFSKQYDECVLTVAKKLNHKTTLTKEKRCQKEDALKEKERKAKENLKKLITKVESKLEKLESEKDKLKTKKPKGYTQRVKEIIEEERDLKEQIDEARENFKLAKAELKDKKINMDVALGTSKSNYSNPMIAYSLCKYCKKDPSVLFTKALRERFDTWVNFEELDEEYWIDYPNV